MDEMIKGLYVNITAQSSEYAASREAFERSMTAAHSLGSAVAVFEDHLQTFGKTFVEEQDHVVPSVSSAFAELLNEINGMCTNIPHY